MSYLDLPRLHFGGLFFTGPSTINNLTENYTPTVQLESGGKYIPGVALWNPIGVAQWWLEECTVLSAVGPDAAPVDAGDPVIGAAVQTPSPKTPMSNGQGGFYLPATMVDLDPDQQGRSALYGVRVAVILANGAGLAGVMTVPELRQLNPRVPVNRGSWSFVGNWMGTLQQVVWSGDLSGSPLLLALKAAGAEGLAVKFTADLHQNDPKTVSTSGDLFCYGRVLGSIGPAFAGELAQVVPGRCLRTVAGPESVAMAEAVRDSPRRLQSRERVAKQTAALAEFRAARSAHSAAPAPWSPAFAVIGQAGSQPVLSIDIGASILLKMTPAVDGAFEVGSGIALGTVNLANGQFVPFVGGSLSFVSPSQYRPLVSTQKNCELVKNSGVFTIPLTAAEVENASANPLAIQVNGTTVAQESSSGLWMDVSVSSNRLECSGGQLGQAQIMVRKFGEPVAGTAPPVTSVVQLFQWILHDGVWTNPKTLPSSNDVGVSIGTTDANGVADITIRVNVPDITVPLIREPLDSQIYLISLNDADGNTVGDSLPALSVLLWKAFQAPANPSWRDVGGIFTAYARLYPGMKARLDISDEATVVGSAAAILSNHMDVPIDDPAYMPVTRDLSPSKMAMIASWLRLVSKQSPAQGSPSVGT